MLNLEHLDLRRGPRLLIQDATLQIHPGWRVGVTGANGTGKSSLFAVVVGQLHADAGELRLPKDWVIAQVAQETPSDPRPAIEFVLDGDAELRRLEGEIATAETAHAGERLAALHEQYRVIGGYEARSRAGRLLHGLGFGIGDEQRAVAGYSGGWRMRLNLARALMCRSDLLLLDEPTNHLDLDALIWLESWLKGYPGTLLLISHDREFLDAVSDHILNIESGRAELLAGNYSAFERIRAERLAAQEASYRAQQREIAHIRSFVERFRAKATKARQAQSRLKTLERMELLAPAHVDSPFHFRFSPPARLPSPLLRIEHCSVGYGNQPVLQRVRFNLEPGDRIGLLGPNGAGKSSLIKLLAGQLAPMGGELIPAKDLASGYFAQHQLDALRPDWTPLRHLQELSPTAREQDLRDFVGGFGFNAERAMITVAPFSGGEKARLALALLVFQRPNLLLLDEPTNHLDLEMRLALTEALQEFDGAMVLVSHDRHLLRACCDRLLLVHDGRVQDFDGELDDYPAWLLARERDSNREPANQPEAEHGAAQRKERKRAEAEQRQALKPLRDKVQAAERELDKLQRRRQEIEAQLADPAIYADSAKARLLQLVSEKGELDARIETTENAWLEALEALEQAQA